MASWRATSVTTDQDRTVVLVQHLRAGGADVAGQLDQVYREPLLRFCWGYLGNMDEAEDALQEVWYKVLTTEEVPDNFRPWIYRVARNHSLNILRLRARRKDGQVCSGVSQIEDALTGHLTRLVKDEMHSRVRAAVSALPESQQEVLRLRYVEDLSRPEIAEILDLTEAVVKSRLFEGIKRLRNCAPDLLGT